MKADNTSNQRKPKRGAPRGRKPSKFDEKNVKRSDAYSPASKDQHNDPGWYRASDQLVSDVASISFNNPAGVPIHFSAPLSSEVGTSTIGAFPGIMTVYTTPAVSTAPVTDVGMSAINIAAKNIYSFVRHANSGHANYDPADLMIYLMSADSLFSYYAYLTRIYGIARTYSQINRYYGDSLLIAMGVNPNDVRANLADLRLYINTFAMKINSVCVPNVMPLFQRHVWMYSNLYLDEDTAKSQIYMYVPAFLWSFSLDDVGAGGLSVAPITCYFDNEESKVRVSTNLLTYESLRTKGNNLASAHMNQEDMGIMSGDILKAYGAENLWKISSISEDYSIAPVFSEEVLQQFHNTDFMGPFVTAANNVDPGTGSLRLRQDPNVGAGNIIFTPHCTQKVANAYDKLMDTWKQVVTPDDVLVMSRNKLLTYSYKVGEVWHNSVVSCGSDICLFAGAWYISNNTTLEVIYCYDSDAFSVTAMTLLEKFNQAPIQAYLNNTTKAISGIFGEISNYTVISSQEIMKLHDTAILSLLGVNYLGTAKK